MKKIELATELVNVMNANRQLSGNHAYTEKELSNLVTKSAARNSKEALQKLLDDEIDRHDLLAMAEEHKRKEFNYDHSEEGKKAKEELHNAVDAWREDLYQEVISDVEKILGNDWGVYCFGTRSFEIKMKDGEGKPIFGNDIEIYYGYDYNEGFIFKANIGTTGEFSLMDDNDRKEFYIGVGKFMSSPLLAQMKEEMKQYHDNVREAVKAYDAKKEAYMAA